MNIVLSGDDIKREEELTLQSEAACKESWK